MPLGAPVAYKGYGLAMAVDIIAGILSGRGPAFDKASKEQGVFQMAIKIDAFQPVREFKSGVDRLFRTVKNSKRAPGFKEILIPGEPELRSERERIRTGIGVPQETWERILQTAEQINVDVERLLSGR